MCEKGGSTETVKSKLSLNLAWLLQVWFGLELTRTGLVWIHNNCFSMFSFETDVMALATRNLDGKKGSLVANFSFD